VPVYKTKYYYDIGRWKKVSSLDTYDSNKEPIWATSNLPEDIENPEYGNQRLGNRTEKYYIQITDEKGNSYSRPCVRDCSCLRAEQNSSSQN
jgi:hypothetical protein